MWRARIGGISMGREGGAAAAPLWRMIAFRLLALREASTSAPPDHRVAPAVTQRVLGRQS